MNKLYKLFRSLVLAVALVALMTVYALPAQAQTTKQVKFFVWLDAPANNYFDYWTGDYCLGGDTLTVYKIGSGLQPWFYMYATHGDNPIASSNNALLLDCKNNSSAWYTMTPGDWKIVGGNPSHTTYFTVQSAGSPTMLVGHRMTSWSGQ